MKKGAYFLLLAIAASAALYAGNQSQTPISACCGQTTQCDPDTCDEPCEINCCE